LVNDRQVKLYRKKRSAGKTQEAAAAAAGICPKTARKWEVGTLPSIVKKSKEPRSWRTRPDPLAQVWEPHVVPLLVEDTEGKLQATTILETLKKQQGEEKVSDNILRTLQRRVEGWRAMNGPGKEVFFPQAHPPGREGQIDFTHAEELGITVAGQPFPHLYFEFILSFSGWRFAEICFGETFEALVKGTQDALWDLGGLMAVLRSDNLSAATYQLKGERKPTKRFQAVLDHLTIDYTRINAGHSNENGKVEKAHDVFKTAVDQALIVRGSREFPTVKAYAAFVEEIRQRLNSKVAALFEVERQHLRPLPACRVPEFTDTVIKVRKFSTIRVGRNVYSVPSNLIGQKVTARLHPDRLQVLYRGRVALDCPRLRGQNQQRIDYRHIIHSLVRKPGAFARYCYREELFPTLAFRRGYDALRQVRGDRADIEYLRILHLAAETLESEVETALVLLLEQGKPFDYREVQSLIDLAPRSDMSHHMVLIPDLTRFDNLLTGECNERLTREPVSH